MTTRTLALLLSGVVLVAASACGTQPTSPSASPTAPTGANTSAVAAMSGSWKSAASGGNASGLCSSVTYTVTPTGANTASVNYAATCAGVGLSGTGTATANGATSITWSTVGGLVLGPAPCSFTLSGTATPTGASTATVTYAGTVCGLPVSGSDVLSR